MREFPKQSMGLVLFCVITTGMTGCQQGMSDSAADSSPATLAWTELFNGRDLTGWVPKIRGEPLGSDARETFRVEDGLLTVSYDAYDSAIGFSDTFGHLFYEESLEAYELLIEYRFVDKQFEGGPDWARSNSGVMFHGQDPETMGLQQDFPISLEVQFLGGDPGEVRPTANLCTPGTHVDMGCVQITQHCINASAPTIPDSTWVSITVFARSDGSVRHVLESDTVLAYERPVVGGGEVNEATDGALETGLLLTGGFIALQSESHPIQFRRVAIRPVTGG